MCRLQFSEYPEACRQEVVTEAIVRYDRKKNRNMNANGRVRVDMRNREVSKHRWYSKNGDYESVMFIEATPESELMHRIQGIIKNLKLKIKVVERAGATVKGLLQKSNPFGVRDCGRDNCLICCQGCGTDCRIRGCVYEYNCE